MINEPTLRLGLFALTFVGLLMAERYVPRSRVRDDYSPRRWLDNLLLGGLNVIVLRVLFPWLAVDTAQWTSLQGWGLLNWLHWPLVPAVMAGIVALDAAIYAQHRLMHRFSWLWRLHKVHHSDRVFDVTTAVRFHPVEIVLSMVFKMGCVVLLGVPAIGVVIFEVLLSLGSLWSHANIRLNVGWEHALRKVLVTPEMHRIHHAIEHDDSNRNFGFCLSCWDRWFGSYRDLPTNTASDYPVGLDTLPPKTPLAFGDLLALPWRGSR